MRKNMKEIKEMKRSKIIRYVSMFFAVIAIFGGASIYFYQKSKYYKMALENTYKHSLQDFNDYVNNIYGYLDKGMYVGTAYQLSNISANLLSDTRAAAMCLSTLPASELHLDKTYKFLSQVGAYANALNKKYHVKEEISDEEYQDLENLKNYAKKLNDYVSGLESEMLRNDLKIGKDKLVLGMAKTNMSKDSKEVNFGNIEKNFVSYPKLIYDGPFSDHISERESELTKGEKEVTVNQAKKIAALSVGMDENRLKVTTDKESKIELYCFSGNNISIGVTKQGGYICYILKSRNVKERKIDPGVAIENAKEYVINTLNIEDIEQSYYEINNNCCVVNFVKKDGEVIIYPDLIKVSVALDNGEILSVDAKSYIKNHKDREIKKPAKSKEEAREVVSKQLTIIKEAREAIIPTDGENEVFAYEFVTRGKSGEIVLVYINSNNLSEEQILILSDTQEGILTI